MTGGSDEWLGLEPEMTRIAQPDTETQTKDVSLKVLVRFLGGYDRPRCLIDRRPQPLRSRRFVQHFRTILRCNAVARMKVSGKSFRAIGRELGISHVAAWKLWQQMVDDVCAEAMAETVGRKRLSKALASRHVGDSNEFRVLWSQAAQRFGVRQTTRLLGRPH